MYNTVCSGFYPICPINWCPIFHVFADTICWYSLFIKMHFQLFIFHKLYLADIIMSKIQLYLVCPKHISAPWINSKIISVNMAVNIVPIFNTAICYILTFQSDHQYDKYWHNLWDISWQYQSISVLQQNLADKNVNITRKITREPPDQSLVSFKSDINKTSKIQLSSCSDCHCDKASEVQWHILGIYYIVE